MKAIGPVTAWAVAVKGEIEVHTVAPTYQQAVAEYFGDDEDDTLHDVEFLAKLGINVIQVLITPIVPN
jgi:DUF971 family protein